MNLLRILLVVSVFQLQAQKTIDPNYFSNPLDIPMILSGSFGELRNNHFHSGLDIKTQQRSGVPVYAPADGYVSRIKVGHYGYGKALYIKHPNGYSTVYAHLQKFEPAIQDFVKQNQYKKERYEIELFPKENSLLVKKGDLIAYTGNSGSSGGPHLHYEIRDSYSRPMNPMLFGLEIPDSKDPSITSVFAYPTSNDASVNNSMTPVKLRIIKQKDGTYKTEKISAYGKIGFGIAATDQQNGAYNKNGVYRIKTSYNGKPKIDIKFEKISFDETRYLNRYIDYTYFKEHKIKIQKLFRQTNNPLSIITQEDDNGFVDVADGFSSNFTIEIKDYQGNLTQIMVPVIGKKDSLVVKTELPKDLQYIPSESSSTIQRGVFTVDFPKNALYQGRYLDIKTSGDTLHLHRDNIPVHKNISISMDISNYNTLDKNKLYIARQAYKNTFYYTTTRRKNNILTAKTRTLGSYTLFMDTIAPSIKAVNFTDGKWISNNKTLKIKIEDSHSGISSYRATLNGKFILMEYNYKKDVLTYDFNDDIVTDTQNNLRLIVTDNVGNSSTFEAIFFRKKL
ncbi:MAG: M23 family metallopeptidase [Patiriisocius sp.]|jgi:murein DD-endopeptidase MepM/ murein hydrolase activator NlpD